MPRHLFFLFCVSLLVVLTGCVQVKSESSLKTDGSFQRDLSVVVMKDAMGDSEAKVDVFDSIRLTSKDKWKTTIEDGVDRVTLKASRPFAATERETTDYALKWKEGDYLECKVDVKVLEGGLLEYTETYTWKGKGTEEADETDAKFREIINKEIAAWKPTPEQTNALVSRVKTVVWQAIFGPGDPILPVLMFDSQLAERKLRITIYESLLAELTRTFGETQSAEALRDACRRIVKQFTKETLGDAAPTPDPTDPPQEGDSSEPITTMQAVVSGPGRVIETNGVYDPVEQQIFWSCYSQAAQLQPITFRAVFDPTP